MHSMPFGAVASVHAFLRCSEALKFLGRSHLLLVMTSYFDDFTVLTWQTTAHHTTLVVEAFFQQMGWTVSPEPKKNSPFSEVFDTLGVRFDLSRQEEGIITVGNTPTRIAELTQALKDVLQTGRLSFEQAQSLRGRLLFAERHLWGRNSRQAVIALGDVPPGHSDEAQLQPAQAMAIEFLLKYTLTQAPKHLSLTPRSKAFLWIDGSCEWHETDIAPTCGLGAVLHYQGAWETWGAQVTPRLCQTWARRAGKTQLIFEAELLPYLVSLQMWYSALRDTDLLVFIDNDGARSALTKAFTCRPEGAHIVHQAIEVEESLNIAAAFYRVPTSSNIAGGPSRNNFDLPDMVGAQHRRVPEALLRTVLCLDERS